MSPRWLCNAVYAYLAGDRQHDDKCASVCAPGCDVRAFHALLERPLPGLRFDVDRERRADDWWDRFVRGDLTV